MVAEVIISTSVKKLNRKFDYEIPADMNVYVGSRVFVPFRSNEKLVEAVVVKIKEKSDYEIKPIAKVQKQEGIDDSQIKIAKWMSKRYFCNVADCIKLMLQPGTTTKKVEDRVKEKTINLITLAKEIEDVQKDLDDGIVKSEKQRNVIEFIINNGNATMQDIELFTDASPAIVKTLIKNGYLESNSQKVERNPFIHKQDIKTVNLKLTDEQQFAFDKIMQDQEENNKVESKLNSEIIECDEKNNSNKESNYNSSSENELNKNLKNINNINNKIQLNEYLIYGITGSGKTEIYLQLIEKMLSNNKSSIMLVPEISLTPQTVNRFIERFGEEQIAVLHSKLSIGERYDQWNKIKSGKAKIIIGARSAIFAPAVDLGIIIIDEEHDESYQSEMTPRYDAKEVAEHIAKQKNIPLVLGSATPDMKTFYRANQGEIQLLTLTKRANQSILPKVEIIDLREELASGNKNMISRKLYEEINKNLEMKKQTILFLNRRGFSTFVMCRDCGYTVKCKRCNITMTYHKNENKLKCHYCGYEQDVITECPECHSNNVKYFGAGTQKLEDEVKELFPTASTIRMDVDTVTKKNSHEEILTKFRNENIDILIGTQMVVKGHHFPNVTLVGVIAADGSLNIGDFRANERTFQTLTQVAGRAGRGEDVGRVIIQTYNPDNYAIEYSKSQDYNLFYNTEIEIRKALKYPPFCDIIVIDMSAKSINELRNISKKLHEYLKQRVINEKFGLLLYSPVPSPIDKIKDRIRWRMIIKCKYDDRVNNLLTDMMSEYSKMKVDTARVTVEVNPNNMM